MPFANGIAMTGMEELFAKTCEYVRDTARLEATLALLEWDDRTFRPADGGAYRAEQIMQLSGVIHQRRTDDRLGEMLGELSASSLATDPHSDFGATIARLYKDYRRHSRLSVELVQAISKATTLGQQAWEQARHRNDWASFQPHMETIFSLRRREAEMLSDGGPLYDSLLDHYEEGARSQQLSATLAELRTGLIPLVQSLSDAPARPDGRAWRRNVAKDLQRAASRWVAEQVGYDFQRGRLDETSHPFCTTLGPNDCRILTRYQVDYFPSGFYGTLHEAGHGMYEQGLRGQWYGLPPGSAASLGVHESQSRLWENFIGRSRSFWLWAFPKLNSILGGAWHDFDAEQTYRDANRVQPSLIRVEADEVTYNLHILIRFELEMELITGELSCADAPQAWNDRYHRYLGIRPRDFRDGILQDIHWSAGLIGYFPTYTLGNLYAAQLMRTIARDVGNIDEVVQRGEFGEILQWLREHIHCCGRCYEPVSLIERATGQALSAQPLIDYLRTKLDPIHAVG